MLLKLKAIVCRLPRPLWRSLIPYNVAVTRVRSSASSGEIRSSDISTACNAAEIVNLEGILDNWRKNMDATLSHEPVARCLYRSLKAASAQQLSPTELVQDPKFQAFWQHLCSEVPFMSTNTAVMCLYNCAQYDFKVDASCFHAIINLCLQKVESVPPKAFGILMWSLYKLDLYKQSQPLVKRVICRFHSMLLSGKEFKPQTFANVLWVLATTHTWPKYITAEVLEYVPQRVGNFDFHSLSIVLWAVTTVGLLLPDSFLRAVGDRAALLLQTQLPVISLVHCCWAFGSASYYHEHFFSALKDRILAEPPCSNSFTPRLLSSIAWSCARTGYYHSGLLDHISIIALGIIDRFNSQDLGNLAYCYGYLNHASRKLLVAISQIMSSKPEMAANELACANVVNACLIHSIYPEALLSQLMSHDRVAVLLQKRAVKHLHLCVQIHFLMQVERPDLKHCVLRPPHDHLVTLLVLVESMVHCQRVFTVFHRNICKALLQITGGSQHFTREALTTFSSFVDVEVVLDCEGNVLPIPMQWCGWRQPRQLLAAAYPVKDNPILWQAVESEKETKCLDVILPEKVCVASDWAVKLGNPGQYVAKKFAFEADGPRHYAVNCNHKLGNTVLKHRLLTAHGWNVIAIPHFEWQHLETEQDQINYLAQKMYSTV